MSVIAIASLLATQAPITLLYQPKVGSTLKYSNSLVQSNPMGGGNTTTTMTITQKVLSFANGYYKVENTTSNYKNSGGMGGAKNAEQMKKAIEGKKMVMLFDKFGAMKVEGQGNQPKGMQEMMGAMSGQGSGMLFPTKPVKIGDTWSKTIDIGSMMGAATQGQGKGTGKITMTYKLVKVVGSSVMISATQKGSMNMSMGSPKAGSQPMTMSMTFSGTGSLSVDRTSGTLNSSTMKMNMGVMGQQMVVNMTMKKI